VKEVSQYSLLLRSGGQRGDFDCSPLLPPQVWSGLPTAPSEPPYNFGIRVSNNTFDYQVPFSDESMDIRNVLSAIAKPSSPIGELQ
jgi:hypothetical protein